MTVDRILFEQDAVQNDTCKRRIIVVDKKIQEVTNIIDGAFLNINSSLDHNHSHVSVSTVTQVRYYKKLKKIRD